MLKFITENFSFISYGFEFLALLVGLLCYKKYKGTSTIIFIYFTLFVVFVDYSGATYFYNISFPLTTFLKEIGFNSYAWYNLFWFYGSVVFVLYYIYVILKLQRNKRILITIFLIFTILTLGYYSMYPKLFFNIHSSFIQLLVAFTLLIASAIYFVEFINSESIINALKTFSFYALTAVLIWWLIVTPILLFDAYNSELDWDFANLKRRIFVFANIFMYSCFAIGLIVSKPYFKND